MISTWPKRAQTFTAYPEGTVVVEGSDSKSLGHLEDSMGASE